MTDFVIPLGTRIAAFNASAAMQAIGADSGLEAAREFAEYSGLSTSAHKVYNFEVAGTHTYIADGIRVHNTSVLSALTPGETFQDFVRNSDGSVKYNADGTPYGYVASVDGGFGTVTVVRSEADANSDTTEVRKSYEYTRDGKRIQLEQVDTVAINPATGEEKVVGSKVVSADLDGMRLGEQAAQALTPFLAKALVGDDAGFLESVAVDTILDTVLGNLGEAFGGVIHHSFLEADTNGTVIDRLTEISFEDFGGELIVNGIDSTISVINQLIMAEVFESIELDGIPGAIAGTVLQNGLTTLLGEGAELLIGTEFVQNLIDSLPLSDASAALVKNFSAAEFQINPVSLVVNAVINEILPDLETAEGAAASALTSTLTTAYLVIVKEVAAAFAGPIGAIAGFFVGKVFDFLFDKDPQAWTNIGFDAETGRFKVLDTWQDDGGNVELSRSLAETYVEGMNGFIDAVKAESHNYDELGQWSFGHYESALKNAGAGGQTFADFQATYVNAYVNDLADVQLQDGQRTAVRALEAIEVERLLHEFQNFGKYKGILDAVAAMEEPGAGSFTLTRGPGMPDHPAYGLTFGWTADQDFSQRFAAFLDAAVRQAYGTLKAQFTTKERDTPPVTDWNGLVAAMQEALPFFELAQRPTKIHYGDKVERVVTVSWEEFLEPQVKVERDFWVTTYEPQKMIGSVSPITGQQDILDQFGIEEAMFFTEEQIYQLINSNLQIATDYHTYLENTEEINTLISTAPNSTLAAGWIATLTAAEEMGLADPYDLTGDAIDNVFYTADGNDTVRGAAGNDLIKTYGGDDEIQGGSGADTLYGGSGNDILIGGISSAPTPKVFVAPAMSSAASDLVAYSYLASYPDLVATDAASARWHWANYGQAEGRVITFDAYSYLAANDDVIAYHGNNPTAAAYHYLVFGQHDGHATEFDALQYLLNYADLRAAYGYDLVEVTKHYVRSGFSEGRIWREATPDALTEADLEQYFLNLDGADSMMGEAGNDTIDGGVGNDTLHGGDGEDSIIGGAENDEIHGGRHYDTIDAGDGHDTVWGDNGRDFIDLGAGGDVFWDNDQQDEHSSDTVYGGAGNDVINGGGGHDVFYGDDGEDSIFGGIGNDEIHGGSQYDTIDAGAGNDTVWGDNGQDYVLLGDGDDVFWDNSQNVIHGNDTVFGGKGNDTIHGDGGEDLLHGDDGDDFLYGGLANDKLLGGAGSDTLDGGAGRDEAAYWHASSGIYVDLANTAANTGEAAGDVFVSIENLAGSAHMDTLRGDDATNGLWGGDLRDDLFGRGGNDTLWGAEGDDRLIGGAGADVLDGGSGTDEAAYWDAAAGVTANLLDASNNTGDAAGDTYISIENLAGSTHGDLLVGNNGDNRMWGIKGNDSMHGEAGNDTLFGGDGDDRLNGNWGNDSLNGGEGQDTLSGGRNDDVLTGGYGADTFVFMREFHQDTVQDFETGLDTLQLSGMGYSSVTEALGFATETGGNVVFDFGNGDKLTVLNTGIAALQDDIILT
ncbi:hypothetical protein [Leisingera sp. JC1]|uniref:hypothetical protein n=1 Tax=Leisingera sp. JC1 TaxID=1855282 RepID=UPI0008033C93|nr:hypothetical protein [Leisingera sp. JC1]OBY25204.1 hypothetical protein A9D60_22630 [Leisingera sp. JC1]